MHWSNKILQLFNLNLVAGCWHCHTVLTLVDALMETLCRDTLQYTEALIEWNITTSSCRSLLLMLTLCKHTLSLMSRSNEILHKWCHSLLMLVALCKHTPLKIMYPCLMSMFMTWWSYLCKTSTFFGLDKSSCSYLGVMVWLHCIGCIASKDSKLRLTVRLAHPPDRKLVPFRGSDRLCCHRLDCPAITVPCCLIYIAL